jgi:acyl-coenzyme A thioesterase PaaI-like protein
MSFQPKDPNFTDRVRASFARQPTMATLGVTIAQLAPGEIELAMPYQPAYTQQHGFIARRRHRNSAG